MNIRRTLIAAAAALAALGSTLGAVAQTVLKAADVHPAGYPTVVAVENMGKKLEAATKRPHQVPDVPRQRARRREGDDRADPGRRDPDRCASRSA